MYLNVPWIGAKLVQRADGDKPEFQNARCMSSRYKSDPIPRCVSCIRRWAGDTCRFQNIRWILRNEQGECTSFSLRPPEGSCVPVAAPLAFPAAWDAPLERRHIERTKVRANRLLFCYMPYWILQFVVAHALLPVLRREQEHIKHQPKKTVTRAREQDVRATCGMLLALVCSFARSSYRR
jgi:lysine-specific demethylase 3